MEDRQISPSSPVPALAKLLCCLEAFSGADFKVTHLLLVLRMCAVHGSAELIEAREGTECFWTSLSREGLKIYHLCLLIMRWHNAALGRQHRISIFVSNNIPKMWTHKRSILYPFYSSQLVKPQVGTW